MGSGQKDWADTQDMWDSMAAAHASEVMVMVTLGDLMAVITALDGLEVRIPSTDNTHRIREGLARLETLKAFTEKHRHSFREVQSAKYKSLSGQP